MEPLKVQKKVMPQQHYFLQFLLNLTKVMLLRHDFFLDFQCICCYKVLYLYLMVWGVTDWAFSVWTSNCTYTVDICHFPPFLAQLSPPTNPLQPSGPVIRLNFKDFQDTSTWYVFKGLQDLGMFSKILGIISKVSKTLGISDLTLLRAPVFLLSKSPRDFEIKFFLGGVRAL